MNQREFTWKIGGAQGEGIDSTGEVLALTLHRLGYYVYQYRHFQSLIIGGHSSNKIRVSAVKRRHRGDKLDVLVALDQTSIDENLLELNDGAVVLYDDVFEGKLSQERNVHLVGVPFTRTAREIGNVLYKNMVAIGASAALCGLEPSVFDSFLREKWGKRGSEIVEANQKAIKAGYDFAKQAIDVRFELPQLAPGSANRKRLLMHGNDALALGAVVAGCRVVCAYPITPATEILYSMLKLMPKYGGVVLQAEDEMAACQMAIGANYAGVRAMTSTSGPGLSLMTETLGLAGVSETPVVIVDVQRAGPSTGMPTKTEQGDAFQAVFGSHGEIQRIVLTPGTVEECFYDTQRAFNLADKYQCPVIILTDLVLGLSKQTVDVEDIDFEKIPIDRGELISDEALAKLAQNGGYKRYALTESGISPRALPGQPNGVHIALSYEHDEAGAEMDRPDMRVLQTDKRMRKMSTLDTNQFGFHYWGASNPDVLLIGWGSTVGQLAEAREALAGEGVSVGQAHVTALHPLPAASLDRAIRSAGRVYVVENNATGQLAELIKKEVGHADRLESILKYDGDPFLVSEILGRVREVVGVKEAV